MGRLESPPDLGHIQLGVDLGGRDGFVAQKLLYDPKVCSSFKKVDRIGVAQSVRRDMALDACRLDVKI